MKRSASLLRIGVSTLIGSMTVQAAVLALPAVAFAQTVPNGLVAQYTFDDGTGLDSTGGNDAQLVDAEPRSGCMDFNGASSYLVAPDETGLPTGNAARTISFWYNYSGNAPSAIMSLGLGTTPGAQMFVPATTQVNGTNYLFTDAINASNNLVLTSNVPEAGTWNLFTMTYNGSGQWKYYLNGVFTHSGTFQVPINTLTDGLIIGKYESGGLYFLGSMDDVRVYNRVLTSSEITSLANSTQPTCPALRACPNSNTGYEYSLGAAVALNLEDLGGSYRVNGSPVACPNAPGWDIAANPCLFGGAGSSCWSQACLYRRPSAQPYQYYMTHWGNNTTPVSSTSCANYAWNSPHDTNVSVPPKGFRLKNRSCLVRNEAGACLSDVCLWEKNSTAATTALTISANSGPIYGTNWNCSATANPGTSFAYNSQFCMLSLGRNGYVGCSTSVCMWDKTQEVNFCPVQPTVTQCNDGIDNDNDGAADYPADFSCSGPTDNDETNPKAACQDGIDNDNDGLTDYPQDPGCTSKQDNDESNLTCSNTPGQTMVVVEKYLNQQNCQNADGDPQSCVNPPSAAFSLSQTLPTATLQWRAHVSHCSLVGVKIWLDGNYLGSTGLLSPNQISAPFNIGPVAAGNHTITTQAFGAAGGCNYGRLATWGGTTTISVPVPQCNQSQCSDGLDNDNDGATDYPNDFSCSGPDDNDETNPRSQCQDGIDNDNDGYIDFPLDPGCTSKQDNTEQNGAQCADGVDNADPEDTLADYNDPGCYTNGTYNPNDNDETNVQTTPQCRDGIDNDNDGATDYPADFSCSGPDDNDETGPRAQCQDGIDNDNDGLTDYPQDPGCSSRQDNDESNQSQCSDGIDNDNDGATDYPNDFSCSGPNDNDETNPKSACQDGIDNDNDGLTDYPQDPGCSSKQDNDESNAAQVGCIDIVKETFDPWGNPLPITAQFTFTLDGVRTTVNASNGRARFSNVSAGLHTVTETIPSGWRQILVTPVNGNLNVPAGNGCAGIVFKNQQYFGNAGGSSSRSSSQASTCNSWWGCGGGGWYGSSNQQNQVSSSSSSSRMSTAGNWNSGNASSINNAGGWW